MPFRTTALVTALLLGAAAAPAAAQEGHALTLSGPSTATVGKTTTLQATGTVPDSVTLERYLNVYAIAASVVTTCPATYQSALQLKDNSTAEGSETVANFVPAEGDFTIPVAYAPTRAGTFILCGYLHEGVDTMAKAQHDVTVAAAGGGTAGRPAPITKPKVIRSGSRLTCRTGRWSGTPTSLRYHWLVNGKKKAGAAKRTLRITRSLRGKRVACSVRATNAAGSKTARSAAKRV